MKILILHRYPDLIMYKNTFFVTQNDFSKEYLSEIISYNDSYKRRKISISIRKFVKRCTKRSPSIKLID